MNNKRAARISQEIKKALSHIISFELNDPKISSMTSVSDVEVSSDLSHAEIFISVLGKDWDKKQTLEGLEQAEGFLKRELGKAVKLRQMPELRFHIDNSIEHGLYMDQLIRETLEADRRNHVDDPAGPAVELQAENE